MVRLRLSLTLRIERERPPTGPESREGQADALVDTHPSVFATRHEYPFGFQPHPDEPEDRRP